MLWFYDPGFNYGDGRVPDVHGFVLDKPSRIRAGLIAAGVAAPDDFVSPAPLGESADPRGRICRNQSGGGRVAARSAESLGDGQEEREVRVYRVWIGTAEYDRLVG